MENCTLIGLPIFSLAKYRGMGEAVNALRQAGIAKTLTSSAAHFNDLGDVSLSQITEDHGPPNLWNFQQFLLDMDAAQMAANRVDAADFVFCLGGECTLVTGTLAGFKARFKGRPGMLWLDAHGDFNTPETTTSGFLGGMPLAFACGRGPRLHQNIEEARPLLEEKNVVHLASRALDPKESEAMQSSPMKIYSAATIRRQGISKVAAEAATYLTDHSDWMICHLDLDSIDPAVIPAVNYPEPGGLTLEEVKMAVRAVQRTGKWKVFNLTAYNPTLDADHISGQKILTLVSDLLGSP
jgi:arginase